jgi:YebC/PmpR family DNA-binding regulatory protein
MSRHWHNIKDSKGKLDSKRAAKFTVFGRMITLAAKEKGGDPAMNSKLRNAIEKAKEAFTPREVIDRAIKKGTGELASEAIEELVYEGYGPGGSAVLIETVTDNRNRTVGNVKNAFAKNEGTFGAQNSVAWMFERKGVIRVAKDALAGKDPDETALSLVDLGADDVHVEDEGLTAYASVESFAKTKEAIEAAGYKVAEADIEYVTKDPVPFDAGKHAGLAGLIESLEADEDVKDVYTNVEL